MAVGCAGGNTASQLAVAPAFEPKGETKCGVVKSQDRPLIVEWPASDRLALETKARKSLVIVRYSGCEMDVLARCSVNHKYNYLGATRMDDQVEIENADDLYAKLPLGAAGLEAKLERAGKLTLNMSLVGRYEAARTKLDASELQGECEGATHFVYGVTVGAFDLFTSSKAEVGGGVGTDAAGVGAHSSAKGQSLKRNGDEAACARATTDDSRPPEGCAALIRLEVVPLGQVKQAAPAVTQAAAPPAPAPAPPAPAPPAPTPRPPEPSCRLNVSDAESNGNQANVGGFWYSFHDQEGTQILPQAGSDGGSFSMSPGGALGTRFAARMAGQVARASIVYGGMGLNFTDPKGPYDARRYTQLSFYARKGEGSTSRVRVKLPDHQTDPDGGRCKECFNDFGTDIQLTTDWRRYVIPFTSLRQEEGWGSRYPRLDARTLLGIQFHVTEPGARFDIWVDQIELGGCT